VPILFSGPRGFGSVGLSKKLAVAVSVASAVAGAGVAGHCGGRGAALPGGEVRQYNEISSSHPQIGL
jgi:hypothetical protein